MKSSMWRPLSLACLLLLAICCGLSAVRLGADCGRTASARERGKLERSERALAREA
jgi:hypothetical protein